MTALVNSPVFWIGLLAGVTAPYAPPIMITVIRHVENIALVVFLNDSDSWPAALVVACMMPRKEPW